MINLIVRFAYISTLFITVPFILFAVWYRWKFYKSPVYRYSLVSSLVVVGQAVQIPYKKILNMLRCISLVGLALLIARPQLVDQHSKVLVEGVDMMLVLDVSGSMQLFDDLNDSRSRIEVAKQEAINFVKKRENDPIGLVLFANEAVSRCPATLDKKLLESIIQNTELGLINPDGTMLSKGLIMALNRLRRSTSKSKIVILLTDGAPSPGDLDPRAVIELAKKYGVKLYTIGIGSEGGYFEHPVFGIQRVGMPLNKGLLLQLAKSTGGHFFEASNPRELAQIYSQIDALEKTEYETNVYHNYYDIFVPFLWALIGIILLELVLARIVWCGI